MAEFINNLLPHVKMYKKTIEIENIDTNILKFFYQLYKSDCGLVE